MPPPPTIYNALRGSSLDVVELTDRSAIEFYVSNMAQQINKFRSSYKGTSSYCKDLGDFICDIIIETTVQGASLLEVHIIDPFWALLQRDSKGNSFIDVDDQGFIWPPIEVNFPPTVSDATWRICQVRPTTDLTSANMILTFEDKIASQLREHHGPLASRTNETRAEFIRRIVDTANKNPNPGEDKIKFVPLLQKGAFSPSDIGMDNPPASSKHGRNSKKSPGPGATTPKSVVAQIGISIADGFIPLNEELAGVIGYAPYRPATSVVGIGGTAEGGALGLTNPFGLAP